MNYVHAGKRQQGEVQSTGGGYSGPPDASVPGDNPRKQPTEGMDCGDPTCEMAMNHVHHSMMGVMTKPSGVAGSMAPGMNYTHVGMRQPGEVKS